MLTEVRSQEVDRTFTYRVPEELEPWAHPGVRVLVPFGGRSIMGLIVGRGSPDSPGGDAKDLKALIDVLDTEPVVPRDLLELAEWLADRYLCTRSAAMRAVLPPGAFGKAERYYEAGPAVEEALRVGKACAALAARAAKRPVSRAQALALLGGDVRLLRMGIVRGWWRERVEGRVAADKKVRVAVPAVGPQALQEAMEAVRPRAPRQAELLAWWLRRGLAPVPAAELVQSAGVPRSALSALVKRGLVRIEERALRRDPFAVRHWEEGAGWPELNEEQRRALAVIERQMARDTPQPVLLYGVTGSGKTEVYMRAMESALRRGRQAIVLVPEISLTPQTVARFKGRFGDRVAVLHSRLSQGERHDEWMRLRRGEAVIAVGARSAVFAPLDNIGLIVVDEEHEASYKQEESPRYVAREVAWERAKRHGAVLVLGSATPSLESVQLVRARTVALAQLKRRVGNRPLPPCVVVDMRRELQEGNRSMFSRLLQREMRERLSRGEQAVILMNRRGYATFVLCRACGHVMRCPDCDISLTYHRAGQHLRCHYCGYAVRPVEVCPACGSPYIRHFGTGTQRVEEALCKLFPEARIIRMDVDTTRRKGAHEELLDRFARGEANVLVGTQMIAKGLDFPRVGLVGVISADTSLYLPDFRASERTFQLLVQVAGRAGRGEVPGTTVIQTYNPDHYAIRAAADHDPKAFYQRELAMRRSGRYPPFSELTVWRVHHADAGRAAEVAARVERRLREVLPAGEATVMRAAPAPLTRLQGLYRYQVIVKYGAWERVAEAMRQVWRESARLGEPGGVVTVDVAAHMLL
ncbi:MAG: primosomal protein N' [Alicyclobacillaceae bacterium]|nr:primosomal protein N' [Alicyclobacillaceae bacterium]